MTKWVKYSERQPKIFTGPHLQWADTWTGFEYSVKRVIGAEWWLDVEIPSNAETTNEMPVILRQISNLLDQELGPNKWRTYKPIDEWLGTNKWRTIDE